MEPHLKNAEIHPKRWNLEHEVVEPRLTLVWLTWLIKQGRAKARLRSNVTKETGLSDVGAYLYLRYLKAVPPSTSGMKIGAVKPIITYRNARDAGPYGAANWSE